MDELELKSEPLQPRWYSSEEIEALTEGSQRWRNGVRSPIWRPATDLFETTDSIIVRVEIAGMREEDFSISLTRNQLSIRGNRPDIQERRSYHQMEIFFGEFITEVDLPGPVVADEVRAEY
ncbi:MAG: Hsp20/alpha crystallin family protein, partial [Chloroflexota bacterium]